MTNEEVVILGAGITGLAIALQLRRSRPSLKLSILAKDLPNDEPFSQSFASVWAGADWSAFASPGSREAQWERQTYEAWLASTYNNEVPPEIMALVDVEKHVEKDLEGLWSKPWWRHVVKDFRVQEGRQGGPGILKYKSFCLDAPAYLLSLFRTLVDPKALCSPDGRVRIHRTEVSTLLSIRNSYPEAKILINASGLGAEKLVLDGDSSCHSIRGQTLLVQLPTGVEPKIFIGVNSFSSTVAKKAGQDTAHQLSYIIPRAHSGMVILGGSYEPDRMVLEEDTKQTIKILQDSAKLWPALIPSAPISVTKEDSQDWKTIKILRVNVGFRPGRTAGPRIQVVDHSEGFPILHAYGMGGAGYQRSIGVALAVDDELDKVLITPRSL